jgi:hypothetical protein
MTDSHISETSSALEALGFDPTDKANLELLRDHFVASSINANNWLKSPHINWSETEEQRIRHQADHYAEAARALTSVLAWRD